jgi:hypothetical protein
MAWQKNAAGVYYDLETGEVSPAGSPPPGFVAPTVNTTDEYITESGGSDDSAYIRQVANPNYLAPKPTTLEGMLQQYNQSNFDVNGVANQMRQLAAAQGVSEQQLIASIPGTFQNTFNTGGRSKDVNGFTEGSNYNVIALASVRDAMNAAGKSGTDYFNANQGYVHGGANQAQQRWQETQKDDSFGSTGLGQLTSMAVQALASYFGGPIGAAASSYALSGGDVGKAALSAGLTYAGGQLSGTGSGAPGGSWYSPSGDISSVSNKLFSPEMVDVMGGTESAMANTAAQSATNVGGYTPPVEINPIQNSAAGITETQLPPWNPEAPSIGGSSVINPLELPAGNPPLQPTNAAGQAIGAGAAAAAGIGATQAAGAGLTASQLLSGASTAVGAGGLLSSFMNSVGANPLMKALLTGQGIAGIVSGLTSTNGLMSPQEAQAMADPFASSRQQYITQLNALMANPALTTSTPGYQFNLQQGLAGIEAKQAKSGISRTGAGDIGVQQFGQQAAMSSFDQQVANLSKLSGASQSPSAGAQAALTAQGQKVSQRNAGMQAIGQGIGAIGQAQIPGVGGTQPGGYSMPNGWSMTDPNVNTDYTQGYDPNTPSMQPMGGYVADPTTGMAPPQNLWGA